MPDEDEGSVFGFFQRHTEDAEGEQPEVSDEEVTDSEESGEPEEPEGSEEVAAEQEPAADEPGEDGSAEEAEEPSAVPEAPDLAGFASVDALAKGYQEAVSWQTRQAQELAALRQETADMKAFQERLALDMAQRRAEEDPEFAAQWEAQQAAAKAVAEQVSAQVDPLKQQLEIEQRTRELSAVISGFQARHPEVVPNGPLDIQMNVLRQQLDLDVGNPDNLELLYEAAQDPHLAAAYVAVPNRVETAAGRAEAKAMAATMKPQATGEVAKAAAPPKPVPHVEVGNSGAPTAGPPGDRPKDLWDEVVDMASKEKKTVFSP